MKTKIYDFEVYLKREEKPLRLEHCKGQKLIILLSQPKDRIPQFVFIGQMVNTEEIRKVKPILKTKKDYEINGVGQGEEIAVERELTEEEAKVQALYEQVTENPRIYLPVN